MTEDKTYNGWANYETWLVKLWLDNTEGSYERYEVLASEALQEAIDDDEDEPMEEAIRSLADTIKEDHEEAMSELAGVSGLWADILNAAMGEVNWGEIASHYVGDLVVFCAGSNMPGYMPDEPPARFLDFEDAKSSIVESLERDMEDAIGAIQDEDEPSEDDETISAVTSLESRYREAMEYAKHQTESFSWTVSGRAYFVSKL